MQVKVWRFTNVTAASSSKSGQPDYYIGVTDKRFVTWQDTEGPIDEEEDCFQCSEEVQQLSNINTIYMYHFR